MLNIKIHLLQSAHDFDKKYARMARTLNSLERNVFNKITRNMTPEEREKWMLYDYAVLSDILIECIQKYDPNKGDFVKYFYSSANNAVRTTIVDTMGKNEYEVHHGLKALTKEYKNLIEPISPDNRQYFYEGINKLLIEFAKIRRICEIDPENIRSTAENEINDIEEIIEKYEFNTLREQKIVKKYIEDYEMKDLQIMDEVNITKRTFERTKQGMKQKIINHNPQIKIAVEKNKKNFQQSGGFLEKYEY